MAMRNELTCLRSCKKVFTNTEGDWNFSVELPWKSKGRLNR